MILQDQVVHTTRMCSTTAACKCVPQSFKLSSQKKMFLLHVSRVCQLLMGLDLRCAEPLGDGFNF